MNKQKKALTSMDVAAVAKSLDKKIGKLRYAYKLDQQIYMISIKKLIFSNFKEAIKKNV